MNSIKEKKNFATGTPFLLLGLLCPLITFMDMPIGMLTMVIAGISPLDPPNGKTMVLVLSSVIFIWALASVGFYFIAKNKFQFDLFQNRERPPIRYLILAFGILVFSIIQSYFNWDQQFHPIGEYRMIAEQVGTTAGLAFLLQYIYYIFEMVLTSMCVALTQEFAERKFSLYKIPIGGLFAGFLWGFLLHVRQGLVPGLQGLLAGVLFGCIYLLTKKNMRFAFPLIYLSFVL